MKIIVCGAGSIGRSVISYLVKGDNDIIVIDNNARSLDEIAKEFDVLPVLGQPSHPDVLERAGAKDSDMILALTETDEVNMVVCQLAYTLFHIPVKIASVNSETFTDPLWGMLYNDNHLPIDLLISPDIDIAENILNILQYPGCAGILPVWDGKYQLLTLNVNEHCPLLNAPLQHVMQYEDLNICVVNIVRQNKSLLPEMYDVLQAGDQVNLLVSSGDVYKVIGAFGLEKTANERLVIFGGNGISEFIGDKVEHDDTIISCRLIEENIERARSLAKKLNRVVVIHGEMMSDVILKEADIARADAAVALTENDKDNLLASLLASRNGVGTTISVINTPSYNNLMFHITDNILVDRSAITISKILKEIRKAKIDLAYSVARGMGEVWQMKIAEESPFANKKIGELGLSKTCRVVALLHENQFICTTPTTKLEPGDTLLVYVDSLFIRQAEKVFN